MYVILGNVGNVGADHVGNVRDVEAAGRDVGRHHHLIIAAAEAFHRLGSLGWGPVAVQFRDREAIGLHDASQFLGRVLGSHEHEDRGHVGFAQKVPQECGLQVLRNGIRGLGDADGGAAPAADLDRGRVLENLASQRGDHGRHGRGKEQRVVAAREASDDPLHVWEEAHVEHAVRFVQHERGDAFEAAVALIDVIEQAAGRGDDKVRAGPKCPLLGSDRLAADDERGANRRVFREPAADRFDLLGKFARRGNHHGPRDAPRQTDQPVKQRQQKCCGLPRAGLGRGDHVLAGECVGDGSRLNRSRFLVPEVFGGADEKRVQT